MYGGMAIFMPLATYPYPALGKRVAPFGIERCV
jgi:hypothetical protein